MLASVLRTIYSGEDPTKQGDGLFKAELPHPSGEGRQQASAQQRRCSPRGTWQQDKTCQTAEVAWPGERKKHFCVLLPAATEGEPVHEQKKAAAEERSGEQRETDMSAWRRKGPHCRYSCRKTPIFFFCCRSIRSHSTQHRPASLDVFPPLRQTAAWNVRRRTDT